MGFVDVLMVLGLLACAIVMNLCIARIMKWWEDSREY